MDDERKEERQIESETGSRPTLSLPLFLRSPRTLCYCDVCSSSSLLHSAVEAFCSLLSFIRGRAISVFPSGRRRADLKRLWNGTAAGGGRGGRTTMFGCIRAHQISDHAWVVIALHTRSQAPAD